LDYYFCYGSQFDKLVAAYRTRTGNAQLFGKWAHGFWQCKNKYISQEEVLGVARKYRELKIPVDNQVQDWFWWTAHGRVQVQLEVSRSSGYVAGQARLLH
jgi:alpha-D-xyloside xylohydrolase